MCALVDAISPPHPTLNRLGGRESTWSWKEKVVGVGTTGGEGWSMDFIKTHYMDVWNSQTKNFLKAWGKGGKQKVMFKLKVWPPKGSCIESFAPAAENTLGSPEKFRMWELARGSRPLGIDLWLCFNVLSFSPHPPFFLYLQRQKINKQSYSATGFGTMMLCPSAPAQAKWTDFSETVSKVSPAPSVKCFCYSNTEAANLVFSKDA